MIPEKPWPPVAREQSVWELAFCALDDLPPAWVVDYCRLEPVRVRHLYESLSAGHTKPESVLRVLLDRDMLRPGFGGRS